MSNPPSRPVEAAPPASRWGRARRWLERAEDLLPLLGVILFVAALAVLHRELRSYGYAEIAGEVLGLPVVGLLAAVLLTFVTYGFFAVYDALGVRYAGKDVPPGKVAFASFVGYSLSNALGTPVLTGTPIRYRLYSSWGLSPLDFARVVAFHSATRWTGIVAVIGASLLTGAGALSEIVDVSRGLLLGLGAACSAAVAAYLFWARRGGPSLGGDGWDFDPPSGRMSLLQLGGGVAGWLAFAGVLYVLLPGTGRMAFVPFVAVYTVALVAGRVSQVPGGLGVFEAVLLLLMPEALSEGELVASLVAYRTIFYLLPLLLAAVALGVYEVRMRKEALERAVDVVGKGVSTAAPHFLSGLVFVSGVFLLLTGALPLPEGRLAFLGRLLPLSVIEVSHFLGSVLGGVLLILAWSLRRRLRLAYRLTLAVLAVEIVMSATRGLGLIQSGILLAVFAALVTARREFFRTALPVSERLSREWLLQVGVTLAATVWLGLFIYARVDLSADLWWQFTLQGDAPRFLRASVGVAVLFLAYGVLRLLRPGPAEIDDGPAIPPAVDAIVAASDRAHAALVYLGDKDVLLSRSGRSFLMYGVEGRSWVSLGDPLGDPADFDELVWRFRARAHRSGGWPVFYQVRPEVLPLYVDAGLSAIKLGEEALVPLEGFGLEGGARRNLRRTVRKVEEAGGSFRVVPTEEVPDILDELRGISDRWIEEKDQREKRFSLGFFSESYLLRGPVAVFEVEDRIHGFMNVLGGGSRTELSADLMRYRPEAPGGTMEYLFIQLMLWGAANGYERFSLGMAPLSGLDTRPMAPLWNRLGSAMFRYGEHFYNFQGLRAYKEKFDPVWEPRYLVSPGGLAFPRVLVNLATLIGGGMRGVLGR